MKPRLVPVFLCLILTLAPGLATSQYNPQRNMPDTQSQGVSGGVSAVVGEISSEYLNPSLYAKTSVSLIDMSNIISGQGAEFVPDDRQVLGYFTTPLFPGPGRYRINLPMAPRGTPLDLDNNGDTNSGVQVFVLYISANLIGNSYLQQLEQVYTKASALLDPSGTLEGSLLVYAPDGNQAFPGGPGKDGKWFTADDPAVPLEQGYTKVTISNEGKVGYDRSAEVEINRLPAPSSEVPDYSGQGILESYNSLLKLLKERYAYTEYRKLDWDAIREKYLESVKASDAHNDFVSYYLILDSLAFALEDAHVGATARLNLDAIAAKKRILSERFSTSIGASAILLWPEGDETLEDNKIVVLSVEKGSPADKAGWVPGTEIISVDGIPANRHLAELPLTWATGVKEVQLVIKAGGFFKFPSGKEVAFEYRLPGETKNLNTSLLSGDYGDGRTPRGDDGLPLDLYTQGDYVVLQWDDFVSFISTKIAVLEEAIQLSKSRSEAGMILDLRGNLGGYMELYETMASYFFPEAEPMKKNINDEYLYDPKKGMPVMAFTNDYYLNAPSPEMTYLGPLVILIDQGCQSSCEYFTEHLQRLGRATIMGQYPSIGAGGAVTPVVMPGGLGFNYTWGKTVIAGTDIPNLEAKGVKPDIRVPVTLESELAKEQGGDPVMDRAVAALDQLSSPMVRLSKSGWKWTGKVNLSDRKEEKIARPEVYTINFQQDGSLRITADCNLAQGTFTLGEYNGIAIGLGPATLAMCPGDSRGEEFLNILKGTINYGFQEGKLALVSSVDKETTTIFFDPVE